MIKYLLDTNICIYVINARPPVVLARFRRERLGEIGISTISAAELAFGLAKGKSQRNRDALEMFLTPLEVLPFDASVIWRYGELRAELERHGQSIGALEEVARFLAFLASDIAKHPERLQSVDAGLVRRLQTLVGDIAVDLDAALLATDE